MKINQSSCDRCGKCVAECPKKAIGGKTGGYQIDDKLCDDCAGYFDIECVRICAPGAITRGDGTSVEFDTTWRLRTEHLIWLMAVLGSRGNGAFPRGFHYDPFRKLISAAYLDPELEVRMSRNFDDNCVGCESKQADGHAEHCGRLDDACYRQLGIEPGTVMRLWDVVKLAEEKFSVPFLKSLSSIGSRDFVLENFIASLAPGSKALTNS